MCSYVLIISAIYVTKARPSKLTVCNQFFVLYIHSDLVQLRVCNVNSCTERFYQIPMPHDRFFRVQRNHIVFQCCKLVVSVYRWKSRLIRKCGNLTNCPTSQITSALSHCCHCLNFATLMWYYYICANSCWLLYYAPGLYGIAHIHMYICVAYTVQCMTPRDFPLCDLYVLGRGQLDLYRTVNKGPVCHRPMVSVSVRTAPGDKPY